MHAQSYRRRQDPNKLVAAACNLLVAHTSSTVGNLSSTSNAQRTGSLPCILSGIAGPAIHIDIQTRLQKMQSVMMLLVPGRHHA